MSRQVLGAILGVVIAVVLVAACGSSPTPTGPTSVTTTTTTTTTTTPTAPTAPKELTDGPNPATTIKAVGIGLFNPGGVEGVVSDVKPSTHGVVVYIKVSSTWWIKPYYDTVLKISSSGSWSCSTTTGYYDEWASEAVAFVVAADYKPDAHNFPPAGQYIAKASLKF
jgi:hypothetical protein